MTTADPNEKSDLQLFDPEELRKVGLGPLCRDNLLHLRRQQGQEPEKSAALPPENRASAA